MTPLSSIGFSLWALVVAAAPGGGSDAPATVVPATVVPVTAPSSAPPPAPAPLPPSPPPPLYGRPVSPFRLGLTYTRLFRQDGDLIDNSPSTNAIGIDMVFPTNSYGRSRLGLSHQWEKSGAYSARGFRIDLISIGYPITLVNGRDRLILEPILTVLRGEVMFEGGGSSTKFLRLESGFGLELSATIRQWFFAIQPLSVDFRYWVYSSAAPKSRTGLGQIYPFKLAVGHEF